MLRSIVTAVAIMLASSSAMAAQGIWTGNMQRQAGGMVSCEYDIPSRGMTVWITVSTYCPMTIWY